MNTTAADLARLRLPGGPGWIRECSPVWCRALTVARASRSRATLLPDETWRGVVVSRTETYAVFAHEAGELAVAVPATDLALDCTHETGRMHATLWAAERHTGVQGIPSLFEINISGRPVLVFGQNNYAEDLWGDVLADLDPEDPRLLPDGSRYVDALALVLVCLHLAEVSL